MTTHYRTQVCNSVRKPGGEGSNPISPVPPSKLNRELEGKYIKINIFNLGNMYTSQPSSFKHEVKKSKHERKEVLHRWARETPPSAAHPNARLVASYVELVQYHPSVILPTFCFEPKKMLKEFMKGKLGQKDDQVIFIK